MTDMRQGQRGFVLVAAVFLLVVLAALGTFMVTISNTQQLTSAVDVQGARAYWAARAGLEWATAKIVAAPAACPTPPAPFVVEGFTIAIACSVQAYDEGGAATSVFVVTSVASSGGGVGSLGRIERSATLTIAF